jgi:hypothetical protein
VGHADVIWVSMRRDLFPDIYVYMLISATRDGPTPCVTPMKAPEDRPVEKMA